jgi:hypothetical protein
VQCWIRWKKYARMAAVSLAVMRNPWIEFVEADLSSRGLAPTAVLERCTAQHKRQGFPWVEVVEGKVILAVV